MNNDLMVWGTAGWGLLPSKFDPDQYYNKTETDGLLADKANLVHTHVEADITDLDKYTVAEVDGLLATKLDLAGGDITGNLTVAGDLTYQGRNVVAEGLQG